MPLLKDGALVTDDWTPLADDADARPGDKVIVTLDQWRERRERLRGHNGRLGLRLKSDQAPAQIADDLALFDLVALEFPRFGDGRPYSSARLLRERYGFTGELRAVGNVLRDQFQLMLRCGFDAFEVKDEKAVEAWHDATSEIAFTYQPTGRQRASIGVLGRVGAKS
ncbi:DUF934 domain-containing protein [Pelagibius sp. 7325]|uniref:DUF934 domain-containing protein n=1 Tax=Pelagibius sp. 7325 TaxID=3131994 RepID=UPI0030ED4A39